MRVLLIYHYFHPDTVISARIFSDLASALSSTGHKVTVYTARHFRHASGDLPVSEEWQRVRIRRFRETGFSQRGAWGRLFNSAVLQCQWLWRFWQERREYDAVVIGTDPQFAYVMFPFMRWMNRQCRRIHWVFDVYPEIIFAGSPRWMRCLASLTKPFVPWAYRAVDQIVDIGPHMRKIIQRYNPGACGHTITPWALSEPAEVPAPDSAVRKELFGEAKLTILYSGTVGHAHNIVPFIELARECRRRGIDAAFCFAGYGNAYDEQLAMLTPEDTNIRKAGFADESQLGKRLAAADIHLSSLREGWEGLVVPSKFFAALAIGRPVLFHGSERSDVAHWVRELKLGKVLSSANQDEVLEYLSDCLSDKDRLREDQQRAQEAYKRHFAKDKMVKEFERVLKGLNAEC